MPEVRNFKLKPINANDDIFSLLNIAATEDEREVKQAYHAFCLIYHPDKFNSTQHKEHWRIEDQTQEKKEKYAQKIFQEVDSKYKECIKNYKQYEEASQQARAREEKERLSKPIIENLITPILKIVAPRLENPIIIIGIGMSRNTNLYINPPLTNDEQCQLINLLNSVIKSFELSEAALSLPGQRSMFSNTTPRSHNDPFLQTHINEQTKIKIEDFTTLKVLSGHENQRHINDQAHKNQRSNGIYFKSKPRIKICL